MDGRLVQGGLEENRFDRSTSSPMPFLQLRHGERLRVDSRTMAHHAVGPSTPTADNLAMAMSLISSTRSVTLLPAYTKNLMPWSLTSRPLDGDAPTIDLVVAYRQENASPRLALCVSQETCLVKPPPVAFDELPK